MLELGLILMKCVSLMKFQDFTSSIYLFDNDTANRSIEMKQTSHND